VGVVGDENAFGTDMNSPKEDGVGDCGFGNDSGLGTRISSD